MKPVKNTSHPIQYKGICSGLIYTLVHYLPCMATELKADCKDSPCPKCEVLVTYQTDGRESFTIFKTEGIKGWRIDEGE